MVRGCKVTTLQPKTSPLSQLIEWNMSLVVMIGISLLRLCSVHQLCSMLYFWDPIICFLCGSFLCLVFLELTGGLQHKCVPFAKLGPVLLGSLIHAGLVSLGRQRRMLLFVMPYSMCSLVFRVSTLIMEVLPVYWHMAC